MFKMSRRFGKTLNLSILQSFFEMGFEDTEKIFGSGNSENWRKYAKHRAQYLGSSLSLKSTKQPSYELPKIQMKKAIAEKFRRHDEVLEMS